MADASIHVAILMRRYVDLVLSGEKTIESRLTKPCLPPYETIEVGERVFIKESGGPMRATAMAGRVLCEVLDPAAVARWRRDYNGGVCGDDTYWRAKRDARFGTLVWLEDVQPVHVGPAMEPSRGPAWFVLPAGASPVLDLVVTPNTLKNQAVRVPASATRLRSMEGFTLVLPGGERVETSVNKHGYVRYRRWRGLFEACGVRPGWRLRLVAEGGGEYAVQVLGPVRAG